MQGIERRRSPRNTVPDDVEALINGAPARIVEMSAVGAKVEHTDRFDLGSPTLEIVWSGNSVPVGVRVVRSEVVGREGDQLLYQTGLAFLDVDAPAARLIKAILSDPSSAPFEPNRPTDPPPSLDDTWTRQVTLIAHEPELPYVQFRLMSGGWRKDFVESPAQPTDGFTIGRLRHDAEAIQRTFESADPVARHRMQIALASELTR